MKIAITGKGGVGKTTIAAGIIQLLTKRGFPVLALDADPNANLGAALGFPEELLTNIVPISQQNRLIEERTGAKVKQYGQIFKLNPDVADVAEKYATIYNSIPLMVLGGLEKGGSGCACPENTFIRALITDLILYKNQTLVIDMEAGVEHLGRATAQGVDIMLIVVEPGARSINIAQRIVQMAKEINLTKIKLIANKIMNQTDENFIRKSLPELDLIGIIPYDEAIRSNDRLHRSILEGLSTEIRQEFDRIIDKLTLGSELHE
jgi:CO dehydrogenase maturation factor